MSFCWSKAILEQSVEPFPYPGSATHYARSFKTKAVLNKQKRICHFATNNITNTEFLCVMITQHSDSSLLLLPPFIFYLLENKLIKLQSLKVVDSEVDPASCPVGPRRTSPLAKGPEPEAYTI
jgi:hypothetical protein